MGSQPHGPGSAGARRHAHIGEDENMWRSFFLAIGVYVVLLGVQCLGVQKFVLSLEEQAPPQARTSFFGGPAATGAKREITPAPWAPWSLMSTGLVVCLYSFSIPKRMNG